MSKEDFNRGYKTALNDIKPYITDALRDLNVSHLYDALDKFYREDPKLKERQVLPLSDAMTVIRRLYRDGMLEGQMTLHDWKYVEQELMQKVEV